jgi:uncharacterized protein
LDDLLVPEIEREQIWQGFWHACAAGQRRAAERLSSAGADLDWEPDYAQDDSLDGRHLRMTSIEPSAAVLLRAA